VDPVVTAALISAAALILIAGVGGLVKGYRNRPHLRLNGDRYWPERDPLMIRINLRNAGRRPIQVHEAGVVIEQNGRERRIEGGPEKKFPASLGDGESVRAYVLWDELGAEFARGVGEIKRVYADVPGMKLKTGKYRGKRREDP
jgi:hypothetical protein